MYLNTFLRPSCSRSLHMRSSVGTCVRRAHLGVLFSGPAATHANAAPPFATIFRGMATFRRSSAMQPMSFMQNLQVHRHTSSAADEPNDQSTDTHSSITNASTAYLNNLAKNLSKHSDSIMNLIQQYESAKKHMFEVDKWLEAKIALKMRGFMITVNRKVTDYRLRRKLIIPVIKALCDAGLPLSQTAAALYVRAHEDLIRSMDDAMRILNGPIFKLTYPDTNDDDRTASGQSASPYSCRDVYVLNAFITAFCRNGYNAAAIEFAKNIPVSWDGFTYATVMNTHLRRGDMARVRELFAEYRSQRSDASIPSTSDADLNDDLSDRNKLADSYVYSVYINALIKNNQLSELEGILQQARELELDHDPYFLGVVLHAHCVAGNVDAAHETFESLVRRQSQIEEHIKEENELDETDESTDESTKDENTSSFDSSTDAKPKADQPQDNDAVDGGKQVAAYSLLPRTDSNDPSKNAFESTSHTEQIHKISDFNMDISGTIHSLSDSRVDIHTSIGANVWQGVLTGVSRPELLPLARRVFDILLRNAKFYPPAKAFTLMITACSRCGRHELADGYFERMKQMGLQPTLTAYTAILTTHIKYTHDKERIEEIMAEMRARGINQSKISATQAIQKAIMERDLTAAKSIFENIHDPDGAVYVVMARAFLFLCESADEAYEQLEELYQKMCEQDARERAAYELDVTDSVQAAYLERNSDSVVLVSDMPQDAPDDPQSSADANQVTDHADGIFTIDTRRSTRVFSQQFFSRIMASTRYARREDLMIKWLERAKTHGIVLDNVYVFAALYYVIVDANPAKVQALFDDMVQGKYGVRGLDHDRMLLESYATWSVNQMKSIQMKSYAGAQDDQEILRVRKMLDEAKTAVMELWESRPVIERMKSPEYCEAMFKWCLVSKNWECLYEAYSALRVGGKYAAGPEIYGALMNALINNRRGDDVLRVLTHDMVVDGVEPTVEIIEKIVESAKRRKVVLSFEMQRRSQMNRFANLHEDIEMQMWHALSKPFPHVAQAFMARMRQHKHGLLQRQNTTRRGPIGSAAELRRARTQSAVAQATSLPDEQL